MKILSFLVTFYLLLPTSPILAQITFQKTFGVSSLDFGFSVQQTTDGGYIITGITHSFGGGGYAVYLIKTDTNGDSLWTKTFGGPSTYEGRCVQQTTDGGYIITGHIYYSVNNNAVYLIKTDSNGDSLWTKAFGESDDDFGSFVHQTTDGGYIITGGTSSFGAGDYDVYLIKTDANGDLLWSKTFGGTGEEHGSSVQQTMDGGYIITGITDSFGAGDYDVYLIKTDTNGLLLWSKTFGETGDDFGNSVRQTADGGYIITGITDSFGAGDYDFYLIKTDTNGLLLWSKTYGGASDDETSSVQQTTDGGYIIAGFTLSFGAGDYDAYLIRTDSNGDSIWTKTFGGTGADFGNYVQQTTDGGFIITGEYESLGPNSYEVYLIKSDSLGNSGCNAGSAATIVTNPATQVTSPATIVTSPLTIVTTPATIIGSGGTVATLCSTVGINPILNLQASIFNISPNPSPGNFTITFTNAIDRGEVQIFNAYGEKVFTQNIHSTSNTEIHLKHIPGGIYCVNVWDGEKYFSNKIIIQQD